MVSALARKFLEDLRIGLGASGIFPEKKPGNVPGPPEPLLLLFADENHYFGNVSEHAQNNSRGCRKCSGTVRNFSVETIAEKHLVSVLGDKIPRIGGCMFGGFLSREHPCFLETCWRLVGGPPPKGGGTRVAVQKWSPPWGPLASLVWLTCGTCGLGHFGIFTPTPPLALAYK